MQPLTGVRDQPSATAFCQIPITNKALLQAPEAILDTVREVYSGAGAGDSIETNNKR